ncbi:hypothetical protein VHEMI09122 [[Torrubiella] hemipterigena]|uniref:NmrA-like domain-containing protein n=1 Tax=[Torrubiella] hemipterigena TaxID=1531966 RepID=A0A0A1T8U3_9HYPO|nr:hypothetical protein VHEMI09122 [[Torrubiella] hemipterigena]
MIVLTGTTGGIGSTALQTILDRKLVPISDLCISAYNTAGIPAHIKETGIAIRTGNLYEPETLEKSYTGAEALFLVSFPSMGEERFTLHKNAIDAAKAVGIRHIIYTSLSFGGGGSNDQKPRTSIAQVAQAHIRTEAYIGESGLTYTIIRMATYAHLWNNYAGFLNLSASNINDATAAAPLQAVLPGDGPAHWANRADLGEATGIIIANWKRYINRVITLTGPELISGADFVTKFVKHTGRPVDLRIVPAQEAIAWHIGNGSVPPEQSSFLDNWASWHAAIAKGEKAYLDPTLEELLGRKPKTVDDQADEIFGAGNALDTKDLVGI